MLNKLQQAAAQLNKSERGQYALRRISELVADDGINGLDCINQSALLLLLGASWQYPTTVKDTVNDVLEGFNRPRPDADDTRKRDNGKA